MYGRFVYMFVPCACSTLRGQKGSPESSWGFQRLWAATWVLGTTLRPVQEQRGSQPPLQPQHNAFLTWSFQHLYHYPSKICIYYLFIYFTTKGLLFWDKQLLHFSSIQNRPWIYFSWTGGRKRVVEKDHISLTGSSTEILDQFYYTQKLEQLLDTTLPLLTNLQLPAGRYASWETQTFKASPERQFPIPTTIESKHVHTVDRAMVWSLLTVSRI